MIRHVQKRSRWACGEVHFAPEHGVIGDMAVAAHEADGHEPAADAGAKG